MDSFLSDHSTEWKKHPFPSLGLFSRRHFEPTTTRSITFFPVSSQRPEKCCARSKRDDERQSDRSRRLKRDETEMKPRWKEKPVIPWIRRHEEACYYSVINQDFLTRDHGSEMLFLRGGAVQTPLRVIGARVWCTGRHAASTVSC